MLAHPRTLLTAFVAAVLMATLLAVPASAAPARTEPTADTTTVPLSKAKFRVATVNLVQGLSEAGVRHDINAVIRGYGASVLALQERRWSKGLLKRVLPDHWALAMQTGANGMDENPIAWNTRIWKVKQTWLRTLAYRTYKRGSRTVHTQYGTVAVLKHRKTGHVIRAISFHMPPGIHNRATGGPNFGYRDRVETFWRMAKQLRVLASTTPERHQFIALCDCNVSEKADTSDLLVKGKITAPLNLQSQYAAAGYRNGWQIDYVLAERGLGYSIRDWWHLGDLATDHPGVVAELIPN